MTGHLELRSVRHTFAGDPPVEVLDDVSLSVEPGDFVSLVGPSGCGKSTLLRIVAGLLAPRAGVSTIDGGSTIDRPGQASYMPQRDLLLPWRRALDNALLGAEVAGAVDDEVRRRAEAWFVRSGLAGFERAWPAQLSGGMRQRVALLRTFLMDHDVVLLLARCEGAPAGNAGLSLFAMPRRLDDGSRNRYRIVRLKDKLGSRSMAAGETIMEGAVAYLLGTPNRGLKQMMDQVNLSRLSHGFRAAGMMRRCLNDLRATLDR